MRKTVFAWMAAFGAIGATVGFAEEAALQRAQVPVHLVASTAGSPGNGGGSGSGGSMDETDHGGNGGVLDSSKDPVLQQNEHSDHGLTLNAEQDAD